MKEEKIPKLSEKKSIEFDILYKSLVGKEIEIVDSDNKNLIGLKGTLVYESSNLFYLYVGDDIKRVLKRGVVLESFINDRKARVQADVLLGSLTYRIKKMK